MNIYFPSSHYNKNYRGLLFPLLKPFIKGVHFSDEERIALYGVSENDVEFTEVLEEATVVVLTMAWNYYIQTKKESLAIDFVNTCAGLHKKVIIFNAGDFGVRVPFFKNSMILRPSGYASKLGSNEFTLPAFIADPLQKHFQTDTIFERPYKSKAVVGFCGQANDAFLNAVKESIKTVFRNLKTYAGLSKNETQQVLSTSFLRASVLKTFQQSTAVDTNFILRKKYRAGVTEQKDSHKTTIAFYNNLKESDYVVCVRGAGNFSVRFYEALAMGRIPVFINTDCSLPFDFTIDWKKHVVWVEYEERSIVAKKVKEFHATLSQEDFIALQHANRILWKKKLTLDGFFKTFLNEMQKK